MKKIDLIRVIVCPADGNPYVAYIPNTLEAMQEKVHGYIENSQLSTDVAIICNEEGRNLGLPENKSLFVKGFVGDCFIVGTKPPEYKSLPDSKLRFLLPQCMERWKSWSAQNQ